MRYFPFGLSWWIARKLVTVRAYRAHLLRLATVQLVIPSYGPMYYIDGYGDRDV